MTKQVYDYIGIGIGPSNLSVCALSKSLNFSFCCFDKNPYFQWHSGALLPGSRMQTNFLKDLVTPVDPSNPYSILSYLVEKKRFYQLINLDTDRLFRKEFSDYLEWVSTSLPNMHYSTEVKSIHFHKDKFLVETSSHDYYEAKNIVMGSGLTPYVPAFTKKYHTNTLYHSSEFLEKYVERNEKCIAIIGGGQSGAEIMHYILNQNILPKNIYWISRRNYYLPLDESPFANEIFTPEYVQYFLCLNSKQKKTTVNEQKFFSDGISGDTLTAIYQKLYHLKYLENYSGAHLHHGTSLRGIQYRQGHYKLLISSVSSHLEEILVDEVILATGYKFNLPGYLSPLLPKLELLESGGCKTDKDFSIVWNGPKMNKIYLQNGFRYDRGIAEPNLSLLAWRSATIVNSMLPRPHYDVSCYNSLFNWKRIKMNNQTQPVYKNKISTQNEVH